MALRRPWSFQVCQKVKGSEWIVWCASRIPAGAPKSTSSSPVPPTMSVFHLPSMNCGAATLNSSQSVSREYGTTQPP